MAKKSSLIVLTALLLAVTATGLFGDVRWYDGSSDNHYWNNIYNWGAHGKVPDTTSGTVYVKAGLSAQYGKPAPGSDPIITSTEPNVISLYVGDNASGLAEVTVVDGGYLEVMDLLRLGHYLTTPYEPKTHGKLNIEGGRIDVRTSIDVGQARSDGSIVMTGGILTTPILRMRGSVSTNTVAYVDLQGGLLDIGSGSIVWSDIAQSKINITGGTLRVNSTTGINSWYLAQGAITAYDGYSTVLLDTTTEPGYTIATATPYYKAYTPSPANEFFVSPVDAPNTVLSWKPGADAIMHDVYFGTSLEDVTNGTGDTYQGTQESTIFDPNGVDFDTVYYWRVDEYDGTNTVAGDVWTFTVMSNITAEMASDPTPQSGSTGVSREPVLTWTAGEGAVSRDVYFGTDMALVEAGDSSVFMGNLDVAEFAPGSLAAGTTYYWRVDEFDGTDLWQGLVWHFTTLSPSGSIIWVNDAADDNNWNTAENWNGLKVPNLDIDQVIVQPEVDDFPVVNSQVPAINKLFVGRAAKTGDCYVYIEQNGILHTTDLARIGYYRPGYYQHGHLVINGGSFVADGEVQVGSYGLSSYNNDGTITMTGGEFHAEWIKLAAGTFSTGYINLNGGTMYVGASGIEFNNEPAPDRMRISKVDIGAGTLVIDGDKVASINYHINLGNITAYGSADGGLLGQSAFIEGGHPLASFEVSYDSETDKTTVSAYMPDPKQAKNPYPADSQTDAGILSILSWTPGEGAVSHQIYFGTDQQLVADGDASVDMGSQSNATFDPGDLLTDVTYYWRVDEFDGSETTAGKVWSFTAGTGELVEDFEDYADNSELAAAWTAGGGAVISLDTEMVPDNSTNSMKVNYAGLSSSATLAFDSPQDWTRSDVSSIQIPFHGVETNTQVQLSLTIEDNLEQSATVVYGDEFMNQSADDVISAPYRAFVGWRISLAEFAGIDFSAVKKLTITIGDGAAISVGTLYFDNIWVYAPICAPQFIPADITGDCFVDMADFYALASNWLASDDTISAVPATTEGLIAYWKFDGNANEEGGLYNGTVGGDVSWDSTGGYDGNGCAVFNGAGKISILGADALFSNVSEQLTISVWVRGDENTQPVNSCLFAGGDAAYMGHNPFVYMPQTNGNVTFDAGHVAQQEPDWASYFYGWESVNWADNEFADWAGQWVHYAFVKDTSAGSMKIYRDGELVAETLGTFVSMDGTLTFTIGALDRGSYQIMQYHGKIDEMKIFNVALPHQQILTLANQSSIQQQLITPADGNKDGIVSYQDFAEISYFWMQDVLWPY